MPQDIPAAQVVSKDAWILRVPSVVSCFPTDSHVGCNVLMLASAQDSNTDKLETIPQALPNELQAKKYMYTSNYNKIQYNLSNVTHFEVNII